MLNDYEESGPLDIIVAVTPEGMRRAFEREIAKLPKVAIEGGYRDEIIAEFDRLMSADQPCSENLGRGWGGYQLHILDTVD